MDGMLEGMSSRLLTEWMAYYSLEPFGDELIDIHLSRLASIQVSTSKKQVPIEKFRLWKKISAESGKFDPLAYYNELKQAFGFKKKD